MQSILLISQNPEDAKTYIADFAKKHSIALLDRQSFTPEGDSFGIDDIRQLQKTAYLNPSRGKEKLLIVQQADTLTVEAQNALLKILEEPPHHATIFLLAASETTLLPTILSRCQLIRLAFKKEEISTPEQLEENLLIIQKGTVGEKLALAERLAKQENNWLQDSIMLLREKLLANPNDTTVFVLLTQLQEIYKLRKTTNVSLRVLLEYAFLNGFDLRGN